MNYFEFKKLSMSNISISGIHADLLHLQSDGLSGHIGKVFPDLSEHSAWLGGTGESWERGPYYTDGLIPLAFLTKNEELLNKAKKWMDSILHSQEENGFFGPKSNIDFWPRAVVLKSMTSYYLATQDEAVLKFLSKYIEYILSHIDDLPFDFWTYARGLEGLEVLSILPSLSINQKKDLYKKLSDNTYDWDSFFKKFPYDKPSTHYLNKHFFHLLKPLLILMDSIAKKSKTPKIKPKEKVLKSRDAKLNNLYLTTHGVNLAMALKYFVYMNQSTGAKKAFDALNKILKYHGNALHLFSSDEHLNGSSPETGIELCTVVEMMYSMEEIFRLTGDFKAADYAEFYAYNALLTTISQDFTAHQYVQQVNQFDCEVKRHPFYDTNKYGNTFGIEPNFGCCAANMHQGWPKFMHNNILYNDKEAWILFYLNGTTTIPFSDGEITLQIESTYPFSDTIKIKCLESTVKKTKKLKFRIPYKADTLVVFHGKNLSIKQQDVYEVLDLTKGDSLSLTFKFSVNVEKNPSGTYSVVRGPFLFAYEIPSSEFKIKGEGRFYDRGYHPLEKPKLKPLLKNGKVIDALLKREESKDHFFDNKMTLQVLGISEQTGEKVSMVLKPYGLTILRKAEF